LPSMIESNISFNLATSQKHSKPAKPAIFGRRDMVDFNTNGDMPEPPIVEIVGPTKPPRMTKISRKIVITAGDPSIVGCSQQLTVSEGEEGTEIEFRAWLGTTTRSSGMAATAWVILEHLKQRGLIHTMESGDPIVTVQDQLEHLFTPPW